MKRFSEVMEMDIKQIDWNLVWQTAQRQKHLNRKAKGAVYWNKRARDFSDHQAHKSDYPHQFIRILNPEPDWRVLDVGCGSGTIAIPLAERVASITAMDFSESMLSILRQKCAAKGIMNVKPLLAAWEDDWEGLGIGVHDVVIASRSVNVEDLKSAFIKLNRFARQRVYVSAVVGDGPAIRRIINAAGRDYQPSPDYICILNLLYQMGIYANLSFTFHPLNRTYADHEDALNKSQWMLDDMTPHEEERLRNFFQDHLVRQNGSWILPDVPPVRWAVIWWNVPDEDPAIT
jgi:SAM-dependent methyltransferase